MQVKMKCQGKYWLSSTSTMFYLLVYITLVKFSAVVGQDVVGGFYCPEITKVLTASDDGTENLKTTEGRKINEVTLDSFRLLLGCNGQFNFTYSQLKAYYEEKSKKKLQDFYKEFARKAPFCVTEFSTHPNLQRFLPIFRDQKQKEGRDFDQRLPVWNPNDQSRKFDMNEFVMIRIKTPERNLPLLRQWFHLRIKFDTAVQGIFIQPIAGPIGVPFGEFRTDFDCRDIPNLDTSSSKPYLEMEKYYTDMAIIPCKYRPKSALRHPHIFVVGGSWSARKSYNEFHVHFNWIDANCAEAPLMQFLIIKVTNFATSDYKIFNTPVYEHPEFDSVDGIPYPYYPQWNDPESTGMKCNGMVPQNSVQSGRSVQMPKSKSIPKLNYMETDDIVYGPDHVRGIRDDEEQEHFESGSGSGKDKKRATTRSSLTNVTINQSSKSKIKNGQSEKSLKGTNWRQLADDSVDDLLTTHEADSTDSESSNAYWPIEFYLKNAILPQNRKRKVNSNKTSVKPVKFDWASLEETTSNPRSESTSSTLLPHVVRGRGGSSFRMSNIGPNLKRKKRQAAPEGGCRHPDAACKADPDECMMGKFSWCETSLIVYSKNFDDCILDKTGAPDDRKSCPPGPFKCTSSAKSTAAARVAYRKQNVEDSHGGTPCKIPADRPQFHLRASPLSPPPTVRHTTKKVTRKPLAFWNRTLDVIQADFEVAALGRMKEYKRLHGWLMILGFLVLIPNSCFISRFFKETSPIACFGMPAWLVGHAFTSYLGLFISWIGFLSVIGFTGIETVQCSKLKDAEEKAHCEAHQGSAFHNVIGSLAFISYNWQTCDGWIRPDNARHRNIFMTSHCIGGYLSQLLAALCVFVVKTCDEIKLETGILLILSIIMLLTGSAVQVMQDKKLNLHPARRWFPILEGIEVRMSPPVALYKTIALAAQWLLHFSLFGLLVFSYSNIDSKESPVDKNSSMYTFDGLFSGSCSSLGVTHLNRKIWCGANLRNHLLNRFLGCNVTTSNSTKIP